MARTHCNGEISLPQDGFGGATKSQTGIERMQSQWQDVVAHVQWLQQEPLWHADCQEVTGRGLLSDSAGPSQPPPAALLIIVSLLAKYAWLQSDIYTRAAQSCASLSPKASVHEELLNYVK